jgi:hypothetical protein
VPLAVISSLRNWSSKLLMLLIKVISWLKESATCNGEQEGAHTSESADSTRARTAHMPDAPLLQDITTCASMPGSLAAFEMSRSGKSSLSSSMLCAASAAEQRVASITGQHQVTRTMAASTDLLQGPLPSALPQVAHSHSAQST